eukprot:gene12224-15357_t
MITWSISRQAAYAGGLAQPLCATSCIQVVPLDPVKPLNDINGISGRLSSSAEFVSRLASGLTAGAVGQLVAVPADLIKVRIQADYKQIAAGKISEPRYKGLVDAAVKIVCQEGGLLALWRGSGPAVQRAALVNLGELAKQLVRHSGLAGSEDNLGSHLAASVASGSEDNLGTHVAASVASGLVASLVSTPADVVKTRIMNQDPMKPMYKSSLDCLKKSIQAEGVAALYKGFFPTWARLGPWQLVFWVSYERTRLMCGLEAF